MLFVASIFSKPVSIYFLVFFNTVTVNNIQHAVLLLMQLSTVQILSFICADDLIHQIHQIHQTLCNLDSVQRKMIQAEKTARIHRNLNQTESESSESESSEEDIRVVSSTFSPASTTSSSAAGKTTAPSTTTAQDITNCFIVDLTPTRSDNDNINIIPCSKTA